MGRRMQPADGEATGAKMHGSYGTPAASRASVIRPAAADARLAASGAKAGASGKGVAAPVVRPTAPSSHHATTGTGAPANRSAHIPDRTSPEAYRDYLVGRELAPATVEKYVREAERFVAYVCQGGYAATPSIAQPIALPLASLTKRAVLGYKGWLTECFAPATVNAALAATNKYLTFFGRSDLCVQPLRVQPVAFRLPERDLTRADYERLLAAARQTGDERMLLVLQTVCSTGMRVSELRYVTLEAVRERSAVVSNKGKVRRVWLPDQLCEGLLAYAGRRNVANGPVLLSSAGQPIERTYVWRHMKALARHAGVDERKAYPHNLRHLFALTYYDAYRDLDALSEILGHARVETTRIYVATTGAERQRQISSLELAGGAATPFAE